MTSWSRRTRREPVADCHITGHATTPVLAANAIGVNPTVARISTGVYRITLLKEIALTDRTPHLTAKTGGFPVQAYIDAETTTTFDIQLWDADSIEATDTGSFYFRLERKGRR